MKILLVSHEPSQYEEKLLNFKKKFIGLVISNTNSTDEFTKTIQKDDKYNFFILDSKVGTQMSQNIVTSILDNRTQAPLLYLGNQAECSEDLRLLFDKNDRNYFDNNFPAEQELENILNESMDWLKTQVSNQKETQTEDKSLRSSKDYVPMRIRNFFFYEKFPLNVFLKISEEKYAMTIEKDVPFSHEQLSKFLSKKIRHLYIEKDKHLQFLESSMFNATKFFETHKKFSKKCMMAHIRSVSIIQDYLTHVGVTIQLNLFVNTLVNHMIQVLDPKIDINPILEDFPVKEKSIAGKSVICAYTSFFLIRNLGWKAQPVRRKFIFASLFQDTYIKNDELSTINSLTDPSLVNFEEADIKDFASHPQLMAKIALQFTDFPDVDFLISQHHELPNRKGFPNRPSPSEMQVAVCTFNIATLFAAQIDGKQYSKKLAQSVLKVFQQEYNNGNFREPLNKLILTFLGFSHQ